MTDNILYFLTPDSLDASSIASQLQTKDYAVTNTLDYVLGRQFWQTVMKTDRDDIANFPVPINATRLRELRGRRTSDVLNRLTDIGILRRSKYEVGEHPYHYWFADKGFNVNVTSIERSTDVHHNAFDSLQDKLSGMEIELDDNMSHLLQMADVAKSITLSDALDLNDIRTKKCVADYRNRNYYFRQRGFSRRLYHNFGALPKALRTHCKLDGQSLAELDLNNSLWFFAACDLVKLQCCDAGAGAADSGTMLPLMMEGNNKALSNSTKTFIDLATDGRIYEAFTEFVDAAYEKPATRSQAKKAANIVLNGDLEDIQKPTYQHHGREAPNAAHYCWEGIKEAFPEVADHIYNRKQQHEDVTYGQMLSALEVRGIVQETARRCFDNGIPCITIHDCVAAKESEISAVETHLQQSFADIFGITPTTEIE